MYQISIASTENQKKTRASGGLVGGGRCPTAAPHSHHFCGNSWLCGRSADGRTHITFIRARLSAATRHFTAQLGVFYWNLYTPMLKACVLRASLRGQSLVCASGCRPMLVVRRRPGGRPLVRIKAAFGHAPLGCFHCDFFCKSGGLAAALGGFRCRGYFQLVRRGRRLNRNAPDSRASHTAS